MDEIISNWGASVACVEGEDVDKTAGYYVSEIRFKEDVRFADYRGRLVAAMGEALETPHWLLTGGAGVAIVHDGGKGGEVSTARNRAFASAAQVAFIMVDPTSTTDFMNRARRVFDAFFKAFPAQVEVERIGCRSVRVMPSRMGLEELVSAFGEYFADTRPAANILAPKAEVEDVGFFLNYRRDKVRIRSRSGPMKRAQALSEAWALKDVADVVGDVPEVGVFLDLDFLQDSDVPSGLAEISRTLKRFADEQEEAADRLVKSFSARLEPG